jgi:glucose/arabinose dehydrogenase
MANPYRKQLTNPRLANRSRISTLFGSCVTWPFSSSIRSAIDGPAAFPDEYVGDGFTVFHGSWNKARRTGHKVVRVPIENGVPNGAYEDFLVGFVTEDGQAWARPASVTRAQNGSLLLSDDGANLIYRIAYSQ